MSTYRYRPNAHELQFNVAQLLKEPTGATRSYEVYAASIKQFDEDVILVAPIVGEVKFLRTGADILVTGALKTSIQKSCGRCLNSFQSDLKIELEEQFYPTLDIMTGTVLPPPADADEANAIDERHLLDLYEVVRQEFLLESESVRYCQPDCKGLCPHCGQDLNVMQCNCAEDAIDSRWAGLRALQIEDN
jgi:uncharacterized protein